MALYIIGLGLSDEKDITLKGLEAAKSCNKIYLEMYTSKLNSTANRLEILIGKKILPAFRELVETKAEELLIKPAKEDNVALLVVGDALAATTHVDLLVRAKEHKVDVYVIHNASVVNAIAATGLQLYKFGKTASIPYPMQGFEPESFYDILRENQKINSHTLMLLDIKADEDRYMSVGEGIRSLLKVELKRNEKIFSEKTLVIGCARLGATNQEIVCGPAGKVMKHDFKKGMQCLVVPSNMHFMEEEYLEQFKIK